MTIDKSLMKKIIWLIVVTGFVLVIALNIVNVINGIGWVIGILFPFFLGFCIAFVVNIPMSFFERVIFENKKMKDTAFSKKMKRPLSLVLAILVILAILAIVIFYFIPKLTSALANLTDSINTAIPEWKAWLEVKFVKHPAVITWIEDNLLQTVEPGKILDSIMNFFANGADTGFNRIVKLATTVINQAVNIGIGIAVACYLCAGKEIHKKRSLQLLYGIFPERGVDTFLDGCGIANETFHKFITGQCLEAACLGILVGVVLSIAQMPYAFVIAIICSLCCFIPLFGAFIAGICGAIIVLSAKPTYLIAFIIIFVIIRVFDDNVMYPHIIGKSIGMPAVFVLFAITVGGALFGFGGMLFFIPLTSFIYKLIKKGVEYRLEKKKLAIKEDGTLLAGEMAAEYQKENPEDPDEQ